MADNCILACPSGEEISTNGAVPSPSPFLALPSELRLKIYEFLFKGGMIHVDAPRNCRCAACCPNKRKTDRGILLTCKLCRIEARPVLFSSTLWVFPVPVWASVRTFISSPRSCEDSRVVKRVSLDLASLKAQRPSFDEMLPSVKEVIVRANGLARLTVVAKADSEWLSDTNIIYAVRNFILDRESFLPLAHLLSEQRKFSLWLVVRLNFLRPGKVLPNRWQQADFLINLDTGEVDRSSKSSDLAEMK